MRLWTLHPRYLDSKGLVAAWREGLLAQKVLAGKTKGYRSHPQLERFKSAPTPRGAIASYLFGLLEEARSRGYHFNASKIPRLRYSGTIEETKGQLLFEWKHLGEKLRGRAPQIARRWKEVSVPEPHPLFSIVRGGIRPWEKG
jgi:hypothetical protein